MIEIGLFDAMYTARALAAVEARSGARGTAHQGSRCGHQGAIRRSTRRTGSFIVVRDEAQRRRLGADLSQSLR